MVGFIYKINSILNEINENNVIEIKTRSRICIFW